VENIRELQQASEIILK